MTTAYQGYNYSLSGISLQFIRDITRELFKRIDERSKYFVFGEIFINSHGLFSEKYCAVILLGAN